MTYDLTKLKILFSTCPSRHVFAFLLISWKSIWVPLFCLLLLLLLLFLLLHSPYLSATQIFRLCENFSKFYLFPKNFSISSDNISDDFFIHRPQNLNLPPYFLYFSTFPPVSRKLLFPPTLTNVPSVFKKFTCFLHTLCVFRFPPLWPWCIYASPNARTGRPYSSVFFFSCFSRYGILFLLLFLLLIPALFPRFCSFPTSVHIIRLPVKRLHRRITLLTFLIGVSIQLVRTWWCYGILSTLTDTNLCFTEVQHSTNCKPY